MAQLRDAARARCGDALDTLAQIMAKSKNDLARIKAACALLERGYGRPTGEDDPDAQAYPRAVIILPDNGRDDIDPATGAVRVQPGADQGSEKSVTLRSL